jgi:hypothetical protein
LILNSYYIIYFVLSFSIGKASLSPQLSNNLMETSSLNFIDRRSEDPH